MKISFKITRKQTDDAFSLYDLERSAHRTSVRVVANWEHDRTTDAATFYQQLDGAEMQCSLAITNTVPA